jgi:hypothetical protein
MSRTRAYSHAVAHGNDTLLEETDQSAVMLPAGAKTNLHQMFSLYCSSFEANQNEAIQRAFSVGWCQISFQRSRENIPA